MVTKLGHCDVTLMVMTHTGAKIKSHFPRTESSKDTMFFFSQSCSGDVLYGAYFENSTRDSRLKAGLKLPSAYRGLWVK